MSGALGIAVATIEAYDAMGEGRYALEFTDGQTVLLQESLYNEPDFRRVLPAELRNSPLPTTPTPSSTS